MSVLVVTCDEERTGLVLFLQASVECDLRSIRIRFGSGAVTSVITICLKEGISPLFEELITEMGKEGTVSRVFIEPDQNGYTVMIHFSIADPGDELLLQALVQSSAMEYADHRIDKLIIAVAGYFDPGQFELFAEDFADNQQYYVGIMTDGIEDIPTLQVFEMYAFENQVPNLRQMARMTVE